MWNSGLATKYSISCLVGSRQFLTIRSFLFLSVTCFSYLPKHTHLSAISLSAFCRPSPRIIKHEPQRMPSRDFGWKLLAWIVILRIFQEHISARMPYVRGTEDHCDPAPTFRGLLRGITEENSECHCYIAPIKLSDMMSWQTVVQLWPSTHDCWKGLFILIIVWTLN